ncbi:LuxR family transcriptional regulator [Galactobacter caseinivorans]|uniref:LuxR family transcriptional regulator n=1 Tax=Galactobacter caseinivorans TaxID=2676123 RepID=A0A496PI24_9MICC|nr:LuxR family transcriptional regulator [Galactobacter caseinivorans]
MIPTPPGVHALGGTRESEAATVAGLAAPGHGVLVVAHPGEGRTDVTAAAQATLRRSDAPALRCTAHTTSAELLSWYEAHHAARCLRLHDVDTLPQAVTPVLSSLVQDSRAILLMSADAVSMRSASAFDTTTSVGLLCDLWRRRLMGRVDLAPLTDEETAARMRGWVPTDALDSLQLTTATRSARGSVAIARDLAEDLTADSRSAPRRLPRPWDAPFALSARTLHRIASRTRDLPPALKTAAVVLHSVGPLDHAMAARMVGPDVLTRLLNVGLASLRRLPDGDEVDVDGLQVAGLLSVPDVDDINGHINTALAFLERSWRSGLPFSDAPTMALARHFMDLGITEGSGRLFARAATVTARLGWHRETEMLTRTAMADGAGAEVLPTLWVSLLSQDRHQEVLDQAQELLQREPEAFHLEHLHRVCTAASWERTTPDWLITYLTDVVGAADPVLAQILTILTGDAPMTNQCADTFSDYAATSTHASVPRMWAMALTLSQRLSAGDPEALEASVTQARSLRGRLRVLNPAASSMAHDAFLLFDLCCCSAQALAGVDPGGVRRVLEERTSNAVGFGPASGRVAAACASYLHALSAYRRGNTEAATRDITTSMSLLDHSTFSALNASLMRLSLQLARSGPTDEVDPEILGSYLAVGESMHQSAAGPTRLVAEPGWAASAHLYHRVLQGHLEPVAALKALEDPELNAGRFPATLASAHHLRALVSGDPEHLMRAANDLTHAGQTRGARDALTRARSLYLARRATGRANDCAAKLAALPDAEADTELPPALVNTGARPAPPSGLTQRELEICLLVAQGLSNLQIGERLYLSVRTVESHVLQARAKLRAPRRRDIPERLSKELARAAGARG